MKSVLLTLQVMRVIQLQHLQRRFGRADLPRRDLALWELGILNKKDVCFRLVRRNDHAYVINTLDYADNLKTVQDYLAEEGIRTCGRFSEFKYLNMDACIRSAIDMAGRIKK